MRGCRRCQIGNRLGALLVCGVRAEADGEKRKKCESADTRETTEISMRPRLTHVPDAAVPRQLKRGTQTTSSGRPCANQQTRRTRAGQPALLCCPPHLATKMQRCRFQQRDTQPHTRAPRALPTPISSRASSSRALPRRSTSSPNVQRPTPQRHGNAPSRRSTQPSRNANPQPRKAGFRSTRKKEARKHESDGRLPPPKRRHAATPTH